MDVHFRVEEGCLFNATKYHVRVTASWKNGRQVTMTDEIPRPAWLGRDEDQIDAVVGKVVERMKRECYDRVMQYPDLPTDEWARQMANNRADRAMFPKAPPAILDPPGIVLR